MHIRTLTLTAAQQAELAQARDHDHRPYLRERAAALLKIAAGQSVRAVALHGLLRRRAPETVYAWLNRYQAAGFSGLVQHARGWRGFSPSAARTALASAAPNA
jgi:hypothetical protein